MSRKVSLAFTGQVGGQKMHQKELPYKIKKTAESAGVLKAYIYLIMDAQLNIKDRAFHSIDYYKNADDARTPYGTVCGFDWGWKNTFSLGFTRKRIPQSFRFHHYLPHINKKNLHTGAEIGFRPILASLR